jgi:hypothetical protein
MSQELGASTLSTGIDAVSTCEMIDGKGSRRGPPNEKPKMASIRRWELERAALKSFVKGTERFSSWVLRRCILVSFVGSFVDLKRTYLVEFVFAFFGIVHGGLVAVMCEVSCCDETITTLEGIIL